MPTSNLFQVNSCCLVLDVERVCAESYVKLQYFATVLSALCGLWGCKNRPLRFLAGCHTRRLNQAISVLYLGMFYCFVVY